jgi:tungstate transport system substrate-binding protein
MNLTLLKTRYLVTRFISVLLSITTCFADADDQGSILIQSTTSTANSGLYDYLLPLFSADNGITAHVIAVGTGQAIKNAKNCDGDILLVHAKSAEQAFISDGFGVERYDLMYNDFVFVGPDTDPAGISGSNDAIKALLKISKTAALFASRGDDSGTHKKETQLWKLANVNAQAASGAWYRETGSGMGATLNTAVGMQAYTITDRATWISFKNKSNFTIQIEADPQLFNQYGVILINPEKCPTVKQQAGQQFINWLLSEKGQQAIANYKLNDQQLFFPNAKISE